MAIAAFGALTFSAAPAHAETFQVTTNQDLQPPCTAVACSLRAAFSAAISNGTVGDDVINVPAGTYEQPVFTLGTLARQITVIGAGANLTFIQPSSAQRVFDLSGASMTLRGMTIRGGRPTSGSGGNIAINASTLTLDGVRVTDGHAPGGGGGISAISGGTASALSITRSLIDNNAATDTSNGGGITLLQSTFAASLTVADSTIAYNTATAGAGIAIAGVQPVLPTLNGVTLAFNTAATGAGGIQSSFSPASIQGSIFAGNRGANNQIENCTFNGTVTDRGGNVDDDPLVGRCGLTNPASRTNTNPQLATAFDTSQPPALALPEDSLAVDLADCDGRVFDQRGVARPLGAACDAGAYEFDPRPETDVTGVAPPFTLSSSDAGSTFECSLNGGAFVPCTSPWDPGAGPGTHTLAVRAVDPQGNRDGSPATVTFTVQPPPVTPTPTVVSTPEPTPTPTPIVTPTPTPVVNQTIVVGPARGTVRVKLRGSRRYQNLDATQGIPVGSTVDTRKGRVTLTSVPKAGAAPETAVFYDGIFRVTQSRGVTNLTLTEQLARCPKKGRAATAAAKKKSRKLWGNGKGAFRTTGRYSAATVRGTVWLVQDSCAGTLTRVTQGSVTVQHGKKRVIVRAGKRYLARAR